VEGNAQLPGDLANVLRVPSGFGAEPVIHVADRDPDCERWCAARERSSERDRIGPARTGDEHRRAAWQEIGGGQRRQLDGIAGHLDDSTGR